MSFSFSLYASLYSDIVWTLLTHSALLAIAHDRRTPVYIRPNFCLYIQTEIWSLLHVKCVTYICKVCLVALLLYEMVRVHV